VRDAFQEFRGRAQHLDDARFSMAADKAAAVRCRPAMTDALPASYQVSTMRPKWSSNVGKRPRSRPATGQRGA